MSANRTVDEIEDLLDLAEAEAELRRVRSGESKTYTHAEVLARYGLESSKPKP